MKDGSDNWGPWATGITTAERLARVRSLLTIQHMRTNIRGRPPDPLVIALAAAESLEAVDLDVARLELYRLPAFDQRKLLSHYLAVQKLTKEAA
jgi:hypothetical protein